MQIGFIGAGRAGCSLGKYFIEKGITVTGYYSRTVKSAEEAARFTGTKLFKSIEDIVSASDTLFVTTSDDAIGEVWDYIAKYSVCDKIRDKIICHCSGSLSSVVFSGIESTGASACSIHPMLAFSNRFSSYQQLHQTIFTIEGMEKAVESIRSMFEESGNRVFRIKTEEKGKYHCAASIVSNQMIALYQMGIDLLKECGFEEKDAVMLVGPLVKNNINTLLEKGSIEALTGPVERNDVCTVKKHLDALAEDDFEIYRLLAKKLVNISKKKNKDRDYTEICKLLDGKGR